MRKRCNTSSIVKVFAADEDADGEKEPFFPKIRVHPRQSVETQLFFITATNQIAYQNDWMEDCRVEFYSECTWIEEIHPFVRHAKEIK